MLNDELDVAAKAMPGLAEAMPAGSLMELEGRGHAFLADLLRAHAEPAFFVPRDLGGAGGSLLEMAQILRVVGARCPSLSIMMTMHHHTIASFSHGGITLRASQALQRCVAERRALVASAFAEGRPGADTLDSTVQCTRLDGGAGFRVAGSKKPCSMTHHADYIVAGVSVGRDGETKTRGMVLVDRRLDGVRTSDFWPSEILAGADCNCVTFDDVVVADECVLAPRNGKAASREQLAVTYAEIALSCLFQVLISASYLGMASRLCEAVLQQRRGTAAQRVEILSRVETATMAVYRLAERLEHREFSGYLLAQSMLVAFNASAQIEQAVAASARALGGRGYLSNREAQYLVLASRCLDFHPPSSQVREQVVEGCYTELE